ncbi:GNAT family N-acetyltransferase [Lysobacter sp. BMK333-48F3]|uniref:GNAT family N-acetyltransferase n=1 Tax=Lysobacter sp. BMK333-48F3 TaxID=2867962 RepID=UPI001C8B8C6A|nr:GNAT family N-acetyltransferase [Lysobacter sp. BMK333-48F3]MBX9402773.1 GNAT family N-acetyltransferase [Lysobacter sp. BMK333-48F3]
MRWSHDTDGLDWEELSELYRIAPLGIKSAEHLRAVYGASLHAALLRDEGRLIGAGRALADGRDCAYLADIVVHPDYQGRGLGQQIVERLVARAQGHRKILLYAQPGKEGFYRKLGFRPMRTAMAIFADPAAAERSGLIV